MSYLHLTPEEIQILATVDHTMLSQTATWEQILSLCEEAVAYKVASVCIPPSYVARACEYLAGRLPVCTVIGFPNGYNTTATKIFEAKEAIASGAKEIDMVINLGDVRQGHYEVIREELRVMREVCSEVILKVIVEACLLSEEEKIQMCRLVTQSHANFIKTSTGFSSGGATLEDVALFKRNIGPDIRVKAAGGISTLNDAKAFLAAGASRLGTSRIIKIVRKQHTEGY
ncbi:MAG: deoxyribose-phosphate aldolase [Eubacteriales bacterium]